MPTSVTGEKTEGLIGRLRTLAKCSAVLLQLLCGCIGIEINKFIPRRRDP